MIWFLMSYCEKLQQGILKKKGNRCDENGFHAPAFNQILIIERMQENRLILSFIKMNFRMILMPSECWMF
jgi:hypothetical protein